MNNDDDDDCAFCEVCDTKFDPDNPRTAFCPHCGEVLCSDACLAEHIKDYCRRVDRKDTP